MSVDLRDPIFNNEDKAREHMESLRWPEGPFCPHCGETQNVHRLEGKSHRKGLIQCNSCLQTFTVTVGSVMERSKIPLTKWVLGFHLMAASKKGVSAHQLHRMLGVTYKSAWFMAHRIREAMRLGPLEPPMGSGGGTVEADETYIGTRTGPKPKGGFSHKHAILSLVERGGQVRSFHIDNSSAVNVTPVVNANISKEAKLMTDDAAYYRNQFLEFASHESVRHSLGEYVVGQVHTNTVLAEFDFRYNNRIKLGVDDTSRASRAIKGAAGKRLTYRQSDRVSAAKA